MVLTITNNDTIQKRHAYKENKDKLSILQRQIEKMTNRQTDKQTNRQTDKQTNRQTDKQTNRQTDKQIMVLIIKKIVLN